VEAGDRWAKQKKKERMEAYLPDKSWYCKHGEEKEAPPEEAHMGNKAFEEDMEHFKFTEEELKAVEKEVAAYVKLFEANKWKRDHFEGPVVSRKRSPDDGRYVVEVIGRLALVGTGGKIKPFKEGMLTPHRVYLLGRTKDGKHLVPVQIPSPNEAALTHKGKVKPFQMGAMELAMVEEGKVKWTGITELAKCKRTAAAEEFQKIFKWDSAWEPPFDEEMKIAFLQLNRSECYSRSPVKRASSKKKRDSSPKRGEKKSKVEKARGKVEKLKARKAAAKKALKKGGGEKKAKKAEVKALKRKLRKAKKRVALLERREGSSSSEVFEVMSSDEE